METPTQTKTQSGQKLTPPLLAVGCALLFFLQSLCASRHHSLTWDEPSFIGAGYAELKSGDFRLNPSHTPLMQQLAASLPFLFLKLRPPRQDIPHWLQQVNPANGYGYQLIFASGNDPKRIAFWARLPVMLIGCLLILAMYHWGSSLFGQWPALLPCFLAALCPNLLAHGHLATEDFGCATFMFLAVYTLWLALERRKWRHLALCGFVTGLALLAKYTALILVPIDGVIVAWYALAEYKKNRTVRWGFYLRLAACVVALASLEIAAAYGFSSGLKTYFSGIGRIYTDVTPGIYHFFLLGRPYAEPRWYYYLACFIIKVPLPMLILLIWSALSLFKEKKLRRPAMFLLVPASLLLLASCFDATNVGLRRILPVLPFTITLTAIAAMGWRGKLNSIAVGGLVAWMILEAVLIFPHHLSYVNLLFGGPKAGPNLLEDSNIDWGQDLPGLAAWQAAQPGHGLLQLMYSGTAAPEAYGVRSALPEMDLDSWLHPRPGTYAVSAHILVGLKKRRILTGLDIDWFEKYRPIARIGYSIYVYRFPQQP